MPNEPLAQAVARLEKMSAKLRTGVGPNYPMLARIQGEIESLAADPPELATPFAIAVIESLSRVMSRLMHDNPKFPDLIEAHVATLHLAAGAGSAALGKAQTDRLMADLETATAKVLGKGRSTGR